MHDGDDVGKEPVHHDSQSSREFTAYGHRMKVRRAAAFAALIAYGWWATALRPFTAAATVAVVGAGAAAMTWSAMHRHVPPRSGVRRPGIVGWIILFGILAGMAGCGVLAAPAVGASDAQFDEQRRPRDPRRASARVHSVAPHRNAIGRAMTRAVTIAGFVVIAIAMVGYEIRARRSDGATIADVLGMLMRTRVGYVVVLASWLWLGWHVFVRSHH